MQILEQSCNNIKYFNHNRVVIKCDQSGYENLRNFITTEMADSVCYIDSNVDSINELFIMTDTDEYVISCDDYVFVNLINVVLCAQSSNPMFNIPSVFYQFFTEAHCHDLVYDTREICDIDYHILENHLDSNRYDIMLDVAWDEFSETVIDNHRFLCVEIVTNNNIAKKLENAFCANTCYYHVPIKNAYVRPCDIKTGTSDYKEWMKLIKASEKLNGYCDSHNISMETQMDVLPGCSAVNLSIVANISTWKHFFNNVKKNMTLYFGCTERELSRIIHRYLKSLSLPEKLIELSNQVVSDANLYEELPF